MTTLTTVNYPQAGSVPGNPVTATGSFSVDIPATSLPAWGTTGTLTVTPASQTVSGVSRAFPCPVQPTFWGCNGHFDWGGTGNNRAMVQPWSYPLIVAAMVDTGLRTFRNGWTSSSQSWVWQEFIYNHATPNGLCVYPNIEGNFDPSGTGSTTEAAAYTVGQTIGAQAASALQGLVPWYEIGNELDSYAITGGSGTSPSNYDNNKFTIARGYVRGCIAGIQSVDTTTPIMQAGVAWIHYAFWDMLQAGTQPDGTTGHPTVSWDISSLHWYTNNYAPNDSIVAAQGTNMLQHAQSVWGKPIRITEWGANYDQYSNSESAVITALTGANLGQCWVSNAATYGIIGADMYQIADADGNTGDSLTSREMNFGMLNYLGQQRGRYAPVKAFLQANPMAFP